KVASLTPYLRHSSPTDKPAACSFSTLIICSSVNLLLRMSVSRKGTDSTQKWGRLRGAGHCFSAMLGKLADISGISIQTLKPEIREIHQRHGTSEYAFLIEEVPSLLKAFPHQELATLFAPALDAYREARRRELCLYPRVAESLLKIKGSGARIIGYTESMAFYSNYRVRRLGLDGVLDAVFSPKDHELPRGLTSDQLRKYPAGQYDFRKTEHHLTPPGELKPNKDILLSLFNP